MSMKESVIIDTKTIIPTIAILGAFVLAGFALWAVKEALVLIVLSFFLALALNPPVNYFAAKAPRGSNRFFGTFISYLIVVGVIGAFIILATPPLISDTRDLVQRLPELVDDARMGDGFIADSINNLRIDEQVAGFVESFTERLGSSDSPVITSLERLTASVVSVLTVLVLTFLMLVEGPRWLDRFWSVYPDDRTHHHKALARKMYDVMTGYVNGQLLVALIAAVSSMLFMILVARIEVSTAVPLAGLVGVLGLIPLIGTTIASSVVILVALFNGVGAAVLMGIFFIVYQQIENNLIQPYIQSKTIEMSPLLILIAVIFGFTAGGVIGGVIAIPVAGMIRVLVLHYMDIHSS